MFTIRKAEEHKPIIIVRNVSLTEWLKYKKQPFADNEPDATLPDCDCPNESTQEDFIFINCELDKE